MSSILSLTMTFPFSEQTYPIPCKPRPSSANAAFRSYDASISRFRFFGKLPETLTFKFKIAPGVNEPDPSYSLQASYSNNEKSWMSYVLTAMV